MAADYKHLNRLLEIYTLIQGGSGWTAKKLAEKFKTTTRTIFRDIDVLNDEMVAAGVRVFVGGLHPARSAKSLRKQPDGKVLITDGPYLETKEHVGGFWVLEAADLDEARLVLVR